MKQAIFLSVKPKYAERILNGGKTVELRRIRPAISKGDRIILYVSSPAKAVRAISTVDKVSSGDPSRLWREVGEEAGITRAEFYDYFERAKAAVAIHIKDVEELSKPIPLAILRELWPGFRPPQNYRYFSPDELSSLLEIEARLVRKQRKRGESIRA